jgi:hypothetical protein
MLILFVSMTILFSMSSLLFMNIIVSWWPSLGFQMNLMLTCTCCHTWHLTLLTIIIDSITVEVLMVFMFMWIWVTSLPWLNQWRLHVQKLPQHYVLNCFVNFLMWKSCQRLALCTCNISCVKKMLPKASSHIWNGSRLHFVLARRSKVVL